jgi:hypothetical protein
MKTPQRYLIATTGLALLLLSGCPPYYNQNVLPAGEGETDTTQQNYLSDVVFTDPDLQLEYDLALLDGFADDTEYWKGFDDSMDTVDGGLIYYSGGDIPFVEWPAADAGYYQGLWYAYNDGYFVAYDYAFTIGFSEGYDLAFNEGWYDFLLTDMHVEYLDGGFSDGYNDGFSEGRILGASDYRDGLPFDWLDALFYYGEPNDIYLEELDLGTGEWGPVYLYEYLTDPATLVKSTRANHRELRRIAAAKSAMSRGFSAETQAELDVRPTTSPRAAGTLRLETTWLERIEEYLSAK